MNKFVRNANSDISDDLLRYLTQNFVPRSDLDAAKEEVRRLSLVVQLQEESGHRQATDSSETTSTPMEISRKAVDSTVTSKFADNISQSQDTVAIGPFVEVTKKEQVSVLFADVVGFTAMSAAMDAVCVADMLRRLFVCLDDLALAYGVQPVDVIGDAYLAAANLDTPCLDHAARLARFAVAAVAAAHTVPVDPAGHSGGHLRIRVGLHCGPVAVAVLSRAGGKRSLIGDTVNTASRMESTGRPDQVQCSGEMAQLLAEQAPELALRPRKGGVVAKGKGRLETFWVGPHPLEVAGRQGPGGSFRVRCAPGGDGDGDDAVLAFGGSFRSEGSFGGSIFDNKGGSFRGTFGGSFGRGDSFGSNLRGRCLSRSSSPAAVVRSGAGRPRSADRERIAATGIPSAATGAGNKGHGYDGACGGDCGVAEGSYCWAAPTVPGELESASGAGRLWAVGCTAVTTWTSVTSPDIGHEAEGTAW